MGLFFKRSKKEVDDSRHNDNDYSTSDSDITYEYILNSDVGRFSYTKLDMTVKDFSEQAKDGEVINMGLRAHEILFLFFCERLFTTSEENLSYFGYRYGMGKKEYHDMAKRLKDEEFIRIASVEETLSTYTVNEIKNVLRKNSLPVSGNKGELIDRLKNNLSYPILEEEFKKEYYCLTEKGRKTIATDRQIDYAHKNTYDNVTIWTITKIVGRTDSEQECELSVSDYLKKRSEVYKNNNHYGFSRNCMLHVYEISYRLGDTDTAFESLAEVLYSDLSGVGNNYNKDLVKVYVKFWFPYETSIIKLPPAAKMWLNNMKKTAEMTNEQMEAKLAEEMGKCNYPFNVFSIAECAKICILEMEEATDLLQQIYKDKEKEVYERHWN